MATSLFFQNYSNFGEQTLLEDLIIESIRQIGEDCYYLPRSTTNFDPLLTEDAQSNYSSSYFVEMYLKNVMGFGGDRNLMSKFAGLEIRDQVIYSMSRRVFAQEIGTEANITRPREGDLIFFPMNNRIFKIVYVENYEMMYQLGALQTYEMTCELFEYSNETFATGITAIDNIQSKYSTNALDYALYTEGGLWLTDENGVILTNENYTTEKIDPLSQNDVFDSEALDFDLIDFSETNVFSEP